MAETSGSSVVTSTVPVYAVTRLPAASRALRVKVLGVFVGRISGNPAVTANEVALFEGCGMSYRRTPVGAFDRLSGEGQVLLQQLADFPKTLVVAMHGPCLGGGLELALACHYRLCTDSPRTQLGLPEVQLGLLPGAGGCNRLPRLIGARAALDIILAGKSERGQKAFRLGLVDAVVPVSILRSTALAAAERLAQSGIRSIVRRPKTGFMGLLLDRNPLGRRIVYAAARKQLIKKTGGHYPAPVAALEAVEVGRERGGAGGYAFERQECAGSAITAFPA